MSEPERPRSFVIIQIMNNHLLIKKSRIITFFIIFLFLLIISGFRFYNNLFRLSYNQVKNSLSENSSICNKISECNLIPGDILIRRYLTKRTNLTTFLLHPYFTHVAFYLGNNQLVEAMGMERNSNDEIKISSFSNSDWLDSGIESFVIIRPNYSSEQLNIIENNLITIANDQEYKFGFSWQGGKRTTCAKIIFDQLLSEKIFNVSNINEDITPDYLFWVLKNHSKNTKMIGFKI